MGGDDDDCWWWSTKTWRRRRRKRPRRQRWRTCECETPWWGEESSERGRPTTTKAGVTLPRKGGGAGSVDGEGGGA